MDCLPLSLEGEGLMNENKNQKKHDFSNEELRKLLSQRIERLSNKHLRDVMNYIEPLYAEDILKPYLLGNEMPKPTSQEYIFLQMASKYNGNIIRTLMLEVGISRYNFRSFVEKYELLEISPGSYVYQESEIDGPFMFQQKYSKATIALESALYFYGYSDVIPKETIMYMPRTYNLKQIHFGDQSLVKIEDTSTSNTRQQLKIFYPDNDPIRLIKNVKTKMESHSQVSQQSSLPYFVATLEQTLVDIVKPQFAVEEEIKVQAYKKYIENYPKFIPRIQRIASADGVLNKVNYYLERRLY